MKILYLFFSFFTISQTKVINWRNAFIEVKRETANFSFGLLKYRINDTVEGYVEYQKYNTEQINKICRYLNFDDFYSFHMKNWVYRKANRIKFDELLQN